MLNHHVAVTGAQCIVVQSLSSPIVLRFYLLWISPFAGNHYIFLAQAFGPFVKEQNAYIIHVRN